MQLQGLHRACMSLNKSAGIYFVEWSWRNTIGTKDIRDYAESGESLSDLVSRFGDRFSGVSVMCTEIKCGFSIRGSMECGFC